ncbi:MAG TPA: hypothetical protein VG206_00445 [Terriglobia bacterium]|nr:hypothetical protein [Terriglobia bacterium]
MRRVSFGMGDDPIFLPLYYWCPTGGQPQYHLADAAAMDINQHGLCLRAEPTPIQYGEWRVRVKLTGDNINETWDTGVLLDRTSASMFPARRRWF